ncbi:MAG TPA: 30S ribosomal protein S3 [Geobacterales bacterium]|nr:30S ribosomal protein S3 [Geobacterales bacterium]
MPTTAKQFIRFSLMQAEVKEYIQNKLKEAGIVNIDVQQIATGLRVIIDVERPKLALGSHGIKIKEIEEGIKANFNVKNVELFVNEAQNPALYPSVIASRIASALERGIHFRRAANMALKQIMEAGALGAEITISGKLVSERSRFEKFRFGIIPKSGQPAHEYVKKAVMHVLLKPGIFGVKVKILPPVELPDDKLRKVMQLAREKLTGKAEEVKQ